MFVVRLERLIFVIASIFLYFLSYLIFVFLPFCFSYFLFMIANKFAAILRNRPCYDVATLYHAMVCYLTLM